LANDSEYDRVLLRAIKDRRDELTRTLDTSDNKMLYAGSGQWKPERTSPTVSYLNGNMPTTGYIYSLQTNKKSVIGERNELLDKTALAKLKEVGNLIVTSTQKELPITGALLESDQYGNGNMKVEYMPYTVPTLPIADSQRPKTRFCARMDSLEIPDQYTDIPSRTEGTTQGRLVWRGNRPSTFHKGAQPLEPL
jgi:hypothetical protein